MVRDDVDDVSESGCVQGRTERVIVVVAAELGVESPVIADVVAMPAPGVGPEMRGAVAIGHAQRGEVRNDIARTRKSEAGMKLQTVRAHGTPRRFRTAHNPGESPQPAD